MLGERNKHSDCLPEVQIAIDVLLVQLLHNQLLQLRAGYVPRSEREEDAANGGRLLSVERLDPLNCDGSDNRVERLVDWKVVETDMFEQRSDVVISEKLQIFLYR